MKFGSKMLKSKVKDQHCNQQIHNVTGTRILHYFLSGKMQCNQESIFSNYRELILKEKLNVKIKKIIQFIQENAAI